MVAIFEDIVSIWIAHLICFPHADVLIAIGEGHLSVSRSFAVKELALINIFGLVFEYSKRANHVGKGDRLLDLYVHKLMMLRLLMLLILHTFLLVTYGILVFFLLNFELFCVHIGIILHLWCSGRSRLDLKSKFALVVDISPVFGGSIDEIVNQVDHFLSNGSTGPITAGSQIVFILAILMSSAAEDFLILVPDDFALVTIFEAIFLISSFLGNVMFD